MADISRNTTPAWQDPHLKDRGDYTEQDIQNIQEKGGILPDFTLDEAEETHLFARVFCFNVCSTGSAVFFRSVG